MSNWVPDNGCRPEYRGSPRNTFFWGEITGTNDFLLVFPGKSSRQLPCRSAEVKIFSVFLCQRCREIWREILAKFSMLRFPGFGCATENFTKSSRQKRCEKRKFHANFTLLGRSAENPMDQGGRKNLKNCPPTSTGTRISFPEFPGSLVTRPKYPHLPRDKCSNPPVALSFLRYRRLSLQPCIFT